MITLNVKEVLICLVLIALLILIVYAIVLIRKLLKTIDETNKVMDDAAVVSKIAAERATDINGMITDVSGTVSHLSHELNDKAGLIKTATNVGKATASAVTYLKLRSAEKKEKMARREMAKARGESEPEELKKKKRLFG